MDSDETTAASRTPGESRTKVHEEALLALVALGFSRPAMEKSLQTILAQTNAPSDSQGLIKAVLNNL